MRFSGKLHEWHEDRGFGFIRPEGGGHDVFVHVSALPFPRPTADEALTFEVALNADGKKKATQVRRQAVEAAALAADRERVAGARRPPSHRPRSKAGALSASLVGLLLMGVIAWVAWNSRPGQTPRGVPTMQFPAVVARPSGFKCDGRTLCSQMTSCSEARLFLAHCPGVQMDGNNDGVPCQQQWCER